MDDQHRQELLKSSAAYATARLSFANAIVIAQRAGESDEEIACVTGYTVPMIRAVLRSSRAVEICFLSRRICWLRDDEGRLTHMRIGATPGQTSPILWQWRPAGGYDIVGRQWSNHYGEGTCDGHSSLHLSLGRRC